MRGSQTQLPVVANLNNPVALPTSHVETVVLLSQLKQKPDDYINVTIELDDVDITSAETKATYDEIKKPIGILQGKSLPRILRQNKYVTKRKNS